MSTSGGKDFVNQIISHAKEVLSIDDDTFLSFFKNSPVAMVVIDPASLRILVANEMSLNLFGYTHEEFIGNRSVDLTYPGDIVLTKENLSEFQTDFANNSSVEKRYVRKDGSVFWAQSCISLLKRGDGKADLLVGITIDITDRKRSEEALRESSKATEDLYNKAPCGYHSLDRDGYFVRMNDTELEWLGYTRDEVIGKLKWTDVITPASRSIFEKNFASFIECGYVANLEYELVGKNGRTFSGLLSATAIYDENGKYLKSRGTLQDITRLKNAETKLHKGYDNVHPFTYTDTMLAGIKAAHDLTNSYIYAKDLEGRYLYVNENVAKLFQLPADEVIGKTDNSFFDIEHANDLRRNDIFVIQHGESVEREEKNILKSTGETKYYRTIKKPIFNNAGEIIGVCGNSTDITDLKTNQQKFKDRESKLEAIINNSPSALSLKTPDGRYKLANPNLQAIHHLSEAEIIDKTDFDLYPDDIAHAFRNNDELILKTKARHSIEELVPVDGQLRNFMSHMFPVFDENGNIQLICRISLDITEQKKATERLKLWATSFEKANFGLSIADAVTNRFISVNPSFAADHEYDPQELIGEPVFLVFPPDRKKEIRAMIAVVDTTLHHVFESEHVTKNGRRFPVLLDITTILSPEGNPMYRIAYALDISQRKRNEEKLIEQDELFMEMSSLAHIGGWGFDPATGEGTWTEEVARIHDVDPASPTSKKYGLGFYHGENREKIERAVAEAIKHGKPYDLELEMVTATGNHKWVRTICHPILREGKVIKVRGAIQDITEQKLVAAQIEHLAYHDSLTDLPNKRLLQDRLRHALSSLVRSKQNCALLMIDLDNFKYLNDTLGHDIGDELLKSVALRLGEVIRQQDTFARIGGDEFLVLVEGLGEIKVEAARQIDHLGEKLLSALEKPFVLGSHEEKISCSVGVTIFDASFQSIDEIVKQADIAMYEAKKAGRNAVRFFDTNVQIAISARVSMEKELRIAIGKNKQLEVHYQLQVKNSGHPVGAEALVRWHHPVRGWISPAEFIPIAESSDLILDIGRCVLETACIQLSEWQKHELTRHLIIAANVSPRQMAHAGFVEDLRNKLRKHAIDPSLLKLEITESMLVHNIEDTIKLLTDLKQIGVKISLDDFGTGYSSLTYLKLLPIDQLKIDQSFVRDIEFDANDRSIVQTIIAMAESLGLDSIAEGVETEGQRQFLQENGCFNYQGYLFGKPMPINHLDALLKKTSHQLD